LENYISADEKEKLIGLKLTGKLNTFDYDFMRTMPALESVDLAQIDNTTIPASCFKESTVKTVILPLNLEAIPDNAFYQSQITSIDIPKTVLSIGNYAFYLCIKLGGTLDLPEGLLSVGDYAFAGNMYDHNNLSGDLIIPNSVKTIGKYAFYNCKGFNGKLTLGNQLQSIQEYTFYGCSQLYGNLIITSDIATIGEYAFGDCKGFRNPDYYIIVGENVQKICTRAFYNTTGANKKIYSKAATPPNLDSSAFDYDSGVVALKPDYLGIPVGSMQSYKSCDGWKYFKIIEEIEF